MMILVGFVAVVAVRYAWRWRRVTGRDTPLPRKL